MFELLGIIIAIFLRLFAGANYLIATIKGAVRPNPITWLFWGLSPLIAFGAQLQYGLQPSAWVTLALGLGPLLIFIVSLTKSEKKRWRLGVFDFLCGASAAVGLVLWQLTSDPVIALLFGILADILGGLPTVYKAYVRPETEKAFPYMLSMMSMVVTLLTLRDWNFINVGFPVYIFCINFVIGLLAWSKVGPKITKAIKLTISK